MKMNEAIKLKARGAGVPLWKIAEALSISEPTLTRWLRHELPEEKKQKILEAIKEIENERG